MRKMPLIAVSFWSLFSLSQAAENAGSIVEIKICEKFICAEVVHIVTEDDTDPVTILDENNDDRDLRSRALVGINLFDGFESFYQIKP